MTGYEWTAISVFSMSANAQNSARYLSASSSLSSQDWNTSAAWVIIYRNSSANEIGTFYSMAAVNLYNVSLDQALLHSVTRRSSSFVSYLNGGSSLTSSSSISSLNTAAGLRIGRSINPPYETNETWSGYSAEIIIAQNLDTTNRQKLEGYLAWKWGLASNLPGDHPYKNSAPTG